MQGDELIPTNPTTTKEFGLTIDQFIESSTFLPNNPYDMSDSEKRWFSDRVFNLSWRVADYDPDIKAGSTITEADKQLLKLQIEASLKTFNYLIYTKPFVIYLQQLFRMNKVLSTSLLSSDSPDPLAILLALRGANSNKFVNGALEFNFKHLVSSNDLYTSAVDNKFVLSSATDKFTDQDFNAGYWDFFASSADEQNTAYISIPIVYAPPRFVVEDFDNCTVGDFGVLATQVDSTVRYNLVIHELLHAFFDWKHFNSENGIDLVYAIHGMVGNLTWGWSDTRDYLRQGEKTLTTPSNTNIKLEDKLQIMRDSVGGYLPMGMVCPVYPSSAKYSIDIAYLLHHMNVAIYPVVFDANNFGAYQDKSLPRAVPKDPFEGVDWSRLILKD